MASDEIPSVLRQFAPGFSRRAQEHGAELFDGALVEFLKSYSARIDARVRDGSPGEIVHLFLRPGAISGGCTCTSHVACGHMWAVLLKLACETDALDGFDPVLVDRQNRWGGTLRGIRDHFERRPLTPRGRRRAGEPLWYVIEEGARDDDGVFVVAGRVTSRKSGAVSFAPIRQSPRDESAPGDDIDRALLLVLGGADRNYYGFHQAGRFELPPALVVKVVGEVCRAGRLLERRPALREHLKPLMWSDAPFDAVLTVRGSERGGLQTELSLRRGTERLVAPGPDARVVGGLVITRGALVPLSSTDTGVWIDALAERPLAGVRADELDDFLEALAGCAYGLDVELEIDGGPRVVEGIPRPRIVFEKAKSVAGTDILDGRLLFDYEGIGVEGGDGSALQYLRPERVLVRRDVEAEAGWCDRLAGCGVALTDRRAGRGLAATVPAKKFARVVPVLIQNGFHVQAEGVVYRQARAFCTFVTSGQDWFGVKGTVDFDGLEVPFPRILRALRKQEKLVDLGDGTFGMLPEEWLSRFQLLDELGALRGDDLTFSRTQLGMLDEILGAESGATFDAAFAKAREELRTFESVAAAEPPPSFRGELRPYQKEGVGWLRFLERFGFGGCLADDMGLGKTVQVLAYLAGKAGGVRRRPGRPPKNAPPPSRRTALVIVPRSLSTNWVDEARRFTPELKVLSHTGLSRTGDPAALLAHDLVITTYGTLRRDIELLKGVRFDTVVLDEAQAIKNASTDVARAVRRLQATCRLALSGTPIENHLGELVSLMDFLNPGLFGSHPILTRSAVKSRPQDRELARMLRGVLRPFLLRRTKAAVAPQLPSRTEQTLHCDLDPEQRAHYDELRDHYRAQLLAPGRTLSGGQEKMLVLEALLRLRQIACHPGLVDPGRSNVPAAKLELLMESLAEVLEEGHKVLIFSQFTKFLAIVRERLDRDEVVHEYLDGQTRDRASRVKRFQEDPSVKVFLVSLRAGGLGLNLTAADYVYILDPWWNPAVEAQAIDRAHRIGQDRAVFAYRLVARDTVEERILELQETKRDLADALLAEDAGPLARLTRDDLTMLLG